MAKFSALYNRYGKFYAPKFTLTIGSVSINESETLADLQEIETELSVSPGKANLLRFSMLLSQADSGKTAKTAQIRGALQLGETVKLEAGYGDAGLVCVFLGYLNTLRCRTGEEDRWDLHIEAECLDVKGLMMSRSGLRHTGETTANAAVTEILGKSAYSALATETSVTAPPTGWDLPLLVRQQSDFSLLRDLAEKFRYEFYTYGGAVCFCSARSKNSTVVEFDSTNGIRFMERSATLSGQVNTVTVTGWDDRGECIAYRDTRSATPAMASTKFTSALSAADVFLAEPGLNSMDQAESLAKAEVAHNEHGCGAIRCECCGLPDIRPGKSVTFSGCGAPFNGTFYVTSVTHTLSPAHGFSTVFEAEE